MVELLELGCRLRLAEVVVVGARFEHVHGGADDQQAAEEDDPHLPVEGRSPGPDARDEAGGLKRHCGGDHHVAECLVGQHVVDIGRAVGNLLERRDDTVEVVRAVRGVQEGHGVGKLVGPQVGQVHDTVLRLKGWQGSWQGVHMQR